MSPVGSASKTEPSFLDLSFPDDDDDDEYHPNFDDELEVLRSVCHVFCSVNPLNPELPTIGHYNPGLPPT